jgi:hypothetical protein
MNISPVSAALPHAGIPVSKNAEPKLIIQNNPAALEDFVAHSLSYIKLPIIPGQSEIVTAIPIRQEYLELLSSTAALDALTVSVNGKSDETTVLRVNDYLVAHHNASEDPQDFTFRGMTEDDFTENYQQHHFYYPSDA